MDKKVQRIKELTKQLNQYRDSYYNDSISEISDQEYDNLFDELKKLEEEANIVMANSPTHTVGYEVKSKLEKVRHSHSMLSLDKTKSVDDLKKFAGDKDCLLMCKMDGLTVLLTYENGELIQAETRGNGEEGEIITHNAKVFENIPLHIDYLGYLEIEGEAIITYNDFEKINENLPENEKYKNPRNLVSGSVRQLDSSVAAQRHIKFITWKVPIIEDKIKSDNAFLFRLIFARDLGFEIVPFYTYTNCSSDKENLHNMIVSLQNKAKQLGFSIDGLVMTYDDITFGESLGTTGHHPKHSLAYKFYDDIYPTRLLNVEFTMGKTGVLTPTAIFEPVEIDGTIIERASLHNLSIMKDLGIVSKYQGIGIYKANMIIPQVDYAEKMDCVTVEEEIKIPKVCPICGFATEIVKDNDTEVLVCTNPDCKGKLLGKLSHFCSKNAINIEGMSEATLQFLIDRGWVKSFQDIYKLDYYREPWKKYDGFGDKSVDKLLDNIEKSRSTTLDRFIYGLCIPLIGRTASKDIAKFFNYNYEKFRTDGIVTHYNQIDGFGDNMNDSIHGYLRKNHMMIQMLADEFTFVTKEKSNKMVNLSNKTFVITGSLNHYKNRDKLISVIDGLGGKVSGSVSKKTNYLINNDITSTSGKNKKANELGIPIISEEDFIKMIL
ncbi:MAG: NAD-dependent DNA ligase LigA [Lachnospiraceae bacterium]|nr:NAD-dependent DNA ligase LigA [Lachnospiraceae bacterium]